MGRNSPFRTASDARLQRRRPRGLSCRESGGARSDAGRIRCGSTSRIRMADARVLSYSWPHHAGARRHAWDLPAHRYRHIAGALLHVSAPPFDGRDDGVRRRCDGGGVVLVAPGTCHGSRGASSLPRSACWPAARFSTSPINCCHTCTRNLPTRRQRRDRK